MKTYVVGQPFRGVATYLVQASSAREALAKVNEGNHPDVECVDRDARWIGKAVYARLDKPRSKR